MALSAPFQYTTKSKVLAQTAATPSNVAVGEAPFTGTVSGVNFTPDAAITGATATKRTFTLENRAQDGSGTTVIGTLDFITGVNAVAFDEIAFTLSAVANATNVTATDIIALKEVVTSTGTANPGGQVEITYTRGEAGA